MSLEKYEIKLPRYDILQVLDALEERAYVWNNTVRYAEGRLMADEFVEVAEHKDAQDARAVLQHYRELQFKIRSQISLTCHKPPFKRMDTYASYERLEGDRSAGLVPCRHIRIPHGRFLGIG